MNFSKVSTSVKIAGIRLFHEGFKYGPHKHNDVEVIIVDKGMCMIHSKDEEKYIKIHKSEGLILFPNVQHTFLIDESQSCRISQIQFEVENNSEPLPNLTFFKLLSSGAKYQRIKRLTEIKSCINRVKQNITDKALLQLYCIELFLLLSKGIVEYTKDNNMDFNNDKLNAVINYINDNIYEQLVIEDICEKFDISSRYLRKKFHKATNSTISDFISTERIESAKKLLSISDLSITQISYQMGFSSTQYFNRVFKKKTGCTPTQYRTQHCRQNL